MNLPKAYLLGPYMGELEWEVLRVGPFISYLKKNEPLVRTVILTRPERFDLYGTRADCLIPLILENDREDMIEGHGIKGFDLDLYNKIVATFYNKYKSKYNILKHFYFDISEPYRKLKWQVKTGHAREKVYYEFAPRPENKRYVDKNTPDSDKIIYMNEDVRDPDEKNILSDYTVLDKKFYKGDNSLSKYSITFIGCFIELMKKCKFVVGKIDSPLSLLALMCKVPIIHIGMDVRRDSINALNPTQTPIINVPNLKRGVKIYESNF